MIALRVITQFNEFEAMSSAWDDLLLRCSTQNPYLSHDWICSWWKGYGKKYDFCFVLFEGGSGLMGAVPLVRIKSKYLGMPVSMLEVPAGYWGHVQIPIADNQEECVRLFLEWIHDEKKSHVLALPRLDAKDDVTKLLMKLVAENHEKYSQKNTRRVCIPVHGSWDDYLKGVSKKFRYELKSKSKRIEKLPNFRFERKKSFDDIDKTISMLQSVVSDSWKADHHAGISISKEGRDFYRNLFEVWGPKGMLDLSLLWDDQTPIAFALRINQNNTLYALETSFRQKYFEYSPGLLIHKYLLEQLFQEGSIKTYDLGEIDPYKSRWTNNYKDEINLFVYKRNIKGCLAWTARKLTDILKKKT